MNKEKLVSLTAKDFKWEYITGSGAGGQNRNRRHNTVRVTHEASKAVGFSGDERSQLQNKKKAFIRLSNTKEFKAWLKIESARAMGNLIDIDKKVDEEMKNIKVETRENGKWENEKKES